MKKLLLFPILLLNSLLIYSQAPTIQWQKSLGGFQSEAAHSIQQTVDGGYIVAGHSNSNDGDVTGNHGGYDYWVVKLNNSGIIQWQKSFGGSGYDFATSIIQTTDGGYIVAGYTLSNNGDVTGNHGDNDYWAVKLNNLGIIQWQKTFGGTGYERANSILQTNDGGYIIAGYSNSNDGNVTGHHGLNTYADYWIVKIDNLGIIQWQKSFGGTSADYSLSIQQTIDGSYIVAGYSESNDGDITSNHGDFDCWIVKLDNLGVILWQKSFGGTKGDFGLSIQQTSDSGYIVAGNSASNDGDVTGHHGSSNGDGWIVKLDNAGSIQWQKSLGGTSYDGAYSIQQTSDVGYIVAGQTVSNDGDIVGNHGLDDSWIVKMDSLGVIQWQKCLGGTGNEIAHSIQQTSDGYILANQSNVNNGDVTGHHGNASTEDFWIIKLSPTVGIEENSTKNSITISTNPSTGQYYFNDLENECQIEVYDLTGRLILQTASESGHCIIDLSNKDNGIYFYKVIGENFCSGKLIKQ